MGLSSSKYFIENASSFQCYVNKLMPPYKNITLYTLFFLLKLYFLNEIFPENIVPEERIEVFFEKNEFHEQILLGKTGLNKVK